MRNKTLGVTYKLLKDVGGNDTGEIEALVSAFGNVDTDGDRIIKGAFADSLKAWSASGDPIPMIWSHDWANPMSHIGYWDSAKSQETDQGLVLSGKIDIGVGNPVADQAYRLLKGRRVKQFSVALDIQNETPSPDLATNLTKVDLLEAGPCLKGANTMTDLISIKAENADSDALAEKIQAIVNETVAKAMGDTGALLEEIKVQLAEIKDRAESPAEFLETVAKADEIPADLTLEGEAEELKTEDVEALEDVSEDTVEKADTQFDTGPWDGNAAMSKCAQSNDPAAAFAKVCAGKTNDDPATRAGWRLPHHGSPNMPCNIIGVKAALFREPKAPINNHQDAKNHLDAHLAAYDAYEAAQKAVEDAEVITADENSTEKESEEATLKAADAVAEAMVKLDRLYAEHILESE